MIHPLPFCVYVLQSAKDGGLYIGFTTNLQRRQDEHNNGSSPSTAPRRPFELVFCEYYKAKSDAVRRETYLKTAAGRRTLRLMLQESLPKPSASRGAQPSTSRSQNSLDFPRAAGMMP